jgi:hypothetical protein
MRANIFFFLSTTPLVFKSLPYPCSKLFVQRKGCTRYSGCDSLWLQHLNLRPTVNLQP